MDKRIIKTRKAIFDAFLELLAEKDVSDISVIELCTRAGINKSTFYLHYTGIDDCYKRFVDSYCEHLFGIIENIDYTDVATSPEQTVDSILAEIESHMDYVIGFRNSVVYDNVIRSFKHRIVSKICESNHLTLDANYHQVSKIAFLVGGCVDMLDQALLSYRHDEVRDLMIDVIRRKQ